MNKIIFRKKAKIIFAFVLIFLFNIGGRSTVRAAHTQREWTIIVYVAADNNLDGCGAEDINEMENGLRNVNDAYVIALFDRWNYYWGNQSTYIYEVEADLYPEIITSPTIPLSDVDPSWGDELNTGDGVVFEKFVTWAIEEYPSNKIAVILWNHGSGALAKRTSNGENDDRLRGPFKGICEDWSSNFDRLRMNELRTAIINIYNNTGQTQIDLLGMDACLMADVEVWYQFVGYVNIGVASQEEEPGDGWEYTYLSELSTDPTMSSETMASHIIDYYKTYSSNAVTLSAFRINRIGDTLVPKLNQLGHLMCSNLYNYSSQIKSAVVDCHKNSTCVFFGGTGEYFCGFSQYTEPDYTEWATYFDIFNFCNYLSQKSIPTDLKSTADSVKNAINTTIFDNFNTSSFNWAKGLSIYFQYDTAYRGDDGKGGRYDPEYDGISGLLEFTRYASWDEMHHTYYDSSKIEWYGEENLAIDFDVNCDVILNVNSGTECKFDMDKVLSIAGELSALGTSSNPVIFKPEAIQWYGIEFSNGSCGYLRCCEINDSENMITGESGADVTMCDDNEITLQPGFTVELGGEFYAYVDASLSGGLAQVASYSKQNNYEIVENDENTSEDGTQTEQNNLPANYSLSPNYPNPFNPTTTFKYGLKEEAKVTIKIYNLLGKEIATLVNEIQPVGYQSVIWNGADRFGNSVPSGIYICRIIAGDYTKSQKMVLMK